MSRLSWSCTCVHHQCVPVTGISEVSKAAYTFADIGTEIQINKQTYLGLGSIESIR